MEGLVGLRDEPSQLHLFMCAEQQRPQDINRLGSPPAEAVPRASRRYPLGGFDTLTVSWGPPIRLPDHEQALVGPERRCR